MLYGVHDFFGIPSGIRNSVSQYHAYAEMVKGHGASSSFAVDTAQGSEARVLHKQSVA